RTVRPTLSYGQALTQFRHSVQSMFEVMVGTNRPVSQPGKKPSPFGFTTSAAGTKPAFAPARGSAKPWGGWGCGAVYRPCRQGLCSQRRQTSGSTAVICVGEALASVKLKLPSGHTQRQNVPAGKRTSTASAAPK